jgi:serpin B
MIHKKLIFVVFVIWLAGSFTASAQTGTETGDVNMDQSIDIIDALITAQYYVGLTPAVFDSEAADVDGNGQVDIIDALMIAQYYVGVIDSFPAQAQVEGVEVIKSDLQRRDIGIFGNALDAAVASINSFAFDCYQEFKNGDENIFFSPLSINYALSMTCAGANGNTEAEFWDLLHITQQETWHYEILNAIDQTITMEPANPDPDQGDELQLNLVNTIWGQQDYTFQAPFMDTLALYFGAGLNVVDFTSEPENCRLLINDWVSGQTEGRITDLIPAGEITPLTRIVLTNAIYFKATWLNKFDPADTVSGTFTTLDGSPLTVDMMHGTVAATNYMEVPGEYQAVKLPYQGTKQNSMYIILPEAGRFQVVENTLSNGTWSEILAQLDEYDVIFSLPKFSLEWDSSLVEHLQNMGLNDAFVPGQADFSGIDGSTSLYISEVFHKSFVAVDEEGTEASAATAVIGSNYSMTPSAVMVVDRPFIFAIRNDDSGAIMFMGRVMEP